MSFPNQGGYGYPGDQVAIRSGAGTRRGRRVTPRCSTKVQRVKGFIETICSADAFARGVWSLSQAGGGGRGDQDDTGGVRYAGGWGGCGAPWHADG